MDILELWYRWKYSFENFTLASGTEDCIKQGIGQLLSYVHFENDRRKKKLIIFGKNAPTESEKKYINFIKKLFQKVDFEYMSLEDIESQ